MTPLPHTLDNLCQREKEKVLEMLKQLNKMKKRCAALEQSLESRRLENQRLSGREEVISRELESAQARLIETVESSKAAQVQVEELSLQLQQSESDRRVATARVRESQAEIQALTDAVRRARMKRDRLMAVTWTQARPAACEKAVDAALGALTRADVWAQTEDEPLPSPPPPVEEPAPQAPTVEQARRRPPPRAAPMEFAASESGFRTSDGADDELARLISFLNPH
jgi:hypothetical protein